MISYQSSVIIPHTPHPTPRSLIWNILAEDRSQGLEICSNNSYTSLE
ncbi:MAG: hypothetical protein GPJ13_01275 [Microcystis aeruginosa W11-06]|nr:hypothetical protein [Microcystis aeruginosa W11-03]NCR92448.1 hypothetical protein [Microcystis aeruginosa W11-06]